MKKLQMKTIKCKLKDILRKNVSYDDLFNMLERMNDITSLCYMANSSRLFVQSLYSF